MTDKTLLLTSLLQDAYLATARSEALNQTLTAQVAELQEALARLRQPDAPTVATLAPAQPAPAPVAPPVPAPPAIPVPTPAPSVQPQPVPAANANINTRLSVAKVGWTTTQERRLVKLHQDGLDFFEIANVFKSEFNITRSPGAYGARLWVLLPDADRMNKRWEAAEERRLIELHNEGVDYDDMPAAIFKVRSAKRSAMACYCRLKLLAEAGQIVMRHAA